MTTKRVNISILEDQLTNLREELRRKEQEIGKVMRHRNLPTGFGLGDRLLAEAIVMESSIEAVNQQIVDEQKDADKYAAFDKLRAGISALVCMTGDTAPDAIAIELGSHLRHLLDSLQRLVSR